VGGWDVAGYLERRLARNESAFSGFVCGFVWLLMVSPPVIIVVGLIWYFFTRRSLKRRQEQGRS